MDVGTEFAKALVVGLEEHDGVLTGVVRGVGRQRQGLTHMQSGTVSDIDAVVANCRKALDEAEQMAGLRPRLGRDRDRRRAGEGHDRRSGRCDATSRRPR
jgi:cell division ATPase FtsA